MDESVPTIPATKPAHNVKLVLLGEASVGKSSIVRRFVSNDFTDNREPTIGAAFLTKKCELDDRLIKFEIWDTAGQERFQSLTPMYYRNAQAAVIVFDLTKQSTFAHAKLKVAELQERLSTEVVIALVGNKADLFDASPEQSSSDSVGADGGDGVDGPGVDRAGQNETAAPKDTTNTAEVNKAEVKAYHTSQGLIYFETSAKEGTNVVEVFEAIAKAIPVSSLKAPRAVGAGDDGLVDLRAGQNQAADACNC